MNPKNETMRLQSAEKLFERIKAHEEGRSWCSNGGLDKKAMTAPYTPPSNVAAWLRKYEIENPKGRDYEALTKAAKRKPVGYWEDAPRGAKFGGGAAEAPSNVPAQGQAPSSDSDLYEPVGTVPVVGDAYVFTDGRGDAVVTFVDVSATCYADRGWAAECQNNGELWTSENTHADKYWYAKNGRILKRKQPCVAGVRAWKTCEGAFTWLGVDGGVFHYAHGWWERRRLCWMRSR